MAGESQMFGLKGGTCWGSKNVARFQREAGEWLRFLMAVCEKVAPGTIFEQPLWEFEAVEIRDAWAACIMSVPGPENARIRSLVYNPRLFAGAAFSAAARELWTSWGG
eukprot:4952966-Alexandrium_andersonii.AAC.1